MKLQQILVTTDFSEFSRRVFLPAASLARRFGAEIHLAHVLEAFPPFLYASPTGAMAYVPDKDYRARHATLLEHEARNPAFAGLKVSSHLLDEGNFHDRIPRFQRERAVDLTVSTTHGRSGFSHLILGSFAERLVRFSHSPVLVHHPTPRESAGAGGDFCPKKILVPLDLSENAQAVFDTLDFLIESFRPSVRFLSIVETIPTLPTLSFEGVAFNMDEASFERDAAAMIKDSHERLQGSVDAHFRGWGGGDLVVRHGNPAADIVREAQSYEADLVVMSTHGRSGLKDIFIGSVAERVARNAPCSVLTVRPRWFGRSN